MDEEIWIPIAAAARRLTAAGDKIDRSSLSRYVKQHAEALKTRREGRANLVEFDALRQHRAENIRIETAPATDANAQAETGKPNPTRAAAVADKAQADAAMRQLDLADRLRQTTPTDEVDRAGRAALALMRAAFERAIDETAGALAAKYNWDERTVRSALKQFADIGVGEFHREMVDRLDRLKAGRPAPDDDGSADDIAA